MVRNRDDRLAIDFHGRVHKSMAKILAKEMEPYHPMFIEEPVLPENNEALREIARHTTIPIAVGERMYTRWGFKQLFADGYADIIQPDLSHAGGILEVRKIAAMAEAYDMAVAPHCPLGPIALGLSASESAAARRRSAGLTRVSGARPPGLPRARTGVTRASPVRSTPRARRRPTARERPPDRRPGIV